MPMTQKLWGFEMIQDRENVKTVPMLIRKIFMKKTGDSRLEGKWN